MEAFGLAISAMTLASLFVDCIECLELIEQAQTSEKGFATQMCKVNIIKRQFMVWGESIGLLSPDEGRDDVLDQIEGHQEIKDVLQQIIVMLKDADKLKMKYGVEIDNTSQGKQLPHIEVTERKKNILKNPIIDFINRFTKNQRKHTIATRTRWAVRDSKKFQDLVADLDWFVSKLITVEVSKNTHIRREISIREEVESIVDLSYLSIMEQVSKGPNRAWASAAKLQSECLSSISQAPKTNEDTRNWVAQNQTWDSDDSQSDHVVDGGWKKRQISRPLLPSRSEEKIVISRPPEGRVSGPSKLSCSIKENRLIDCRCPISSHSILCILPSTSSLARES